MKKQEKVSLMINLTELNGVFGKSERNIRRDNYPKKYEEAIKDLNRVLKEWEERW